jgi:hypothetical protein
MGNISKKTIPWILKCLDGGEGNKMVEEIHFLREVRVTGQL